MPVILLYQSWTYYVFRARVTGEEVDLPRGARFADGRVASG